MRIVRGLLVVVLTILIANAAAAADTDTLESRRAAAERYMLTTLPLMLLDLEEAAVPRFLEGAERELYRRMMHETFVEMFTKDNQERLLIAPMVRHFTTAEIEAMNAFYTSPIGQSVLRKFGRYMADIQPAIMELVAQAIRRTMERWRPTE